MYSWPYSNKAPFCTYHTFYVSRLGTFTSSCYPRQVPLYLCTYIPPTITYSFHSIHLPLTFSSLSSTSTSKRQAIHPLQIDGGGGKKRKVKKELGREARRLISMPIWPSSRKFACQDPMSFVPMHTPVTRCQTHASSPTLETYLLVQGLWLTWASSAHYYYR